ncbi:MAG TPA: hypothetical protein VF142_21000, partial [Longimicrobium sp.]
QSVKEHDMTILGGVLFLAGLVLVPLIWRASRRRSGRWGVNLAAQRCPECGADSPRVRAPNSLRQVLWGGWSCRACGTEVDKWGVRVG